MKVEEALKVVNSSNTSKVFEDTTLKEMAKKTKTQLDEVNSTLGFFKITLIIWIVISVIAGIACAINGCANTISNSSPNHSNYYTY